MKENEQTKRYDSGFHLKSLVAGLVTGAVLTGLSYLAVKTNLTEAYVKDVNNDGIADIVLSGYTSGSVKKITDIFLGQEDGTCLPIDNLRRTERAAEKQKQDTNYKDIWNAAKYVPENE